MFDQNYTSMYKKIKPLHSSNAEQSAEQHRDKEVPKGRSGHRAMAYAEISHDLPHPS